jgi:hypothetical protein
MPLVLDLFDYILFLINRAKAATCDLYVQAKPREPSREKSSRGLRGTRIGKPGQVMKSCNVSIRRAVAVKTAAAAAFALTLAVVMAGTAQAQDASEDGSAWNMFDSVLVIPPVYRSGTKPAPANACAEDCPGSSIQVIPESDIPESPGAVTGTADDPANASAGTADNPPDESAGADGSRPDESGWQEQPATAGDSPQSADNLESSLGSVQDYEEQQAEDAAELSNYGIARAPSVIIGVPVGPYYMPRTFYRSAPVFAPIARVFPRPSIVPHGAPGTVEGFHRGFFGGFHNRGFSHMSGFHGGGFSGFHGGFGGHR